MKYKYKMHNFEALEKSYEFFKILIEYPVDTSKIDARFL